MDRWQALTNLSGCWAELIPSQPRQALGGFGHAARLAHALGAPEQVVRGHGGGYEADHGGLPTRRLQAQGAFGIHN